MGFLFIKPEDNNRAIHIFAAYKGKDGNYHTFNEEFDSIEELENIEGTEFIIDEDSDDNEAICHGEGVTLANMGIVNDDNKKYCETIDKAIEYSAIFQNNNLDMCGNCVKRLYKD
ncbi:hypothetical protein [Brachyspira aalborgi]|uniref:hypothetical protein n=1 Tax=Brachyspira aalborgi TaxID=29522 RepID=UPI0026663C6D|nr:hypothetical protein [Brachyspira aalborgi]